MWVVDADEVRLRNLTAARDRNDETRALGRRLGKARPVPLRVLVVSVHPRHDDSTLWWFDQGLLSLLAGADADTRFVTNASYALDTRRFGELGRPPRRFEIGSDDATRALAEPADLVVALTPSAPAIHAAHALGAPFATFVVKAHVGEARGALPAPPTGAKLFHGFARAPSVSAWLGHALGASRAEYEERAAPFPVSRFYFPPSTTPPTTDVLLFGSKDRDLPLAMRALAKAKVKSAAAIANEVDTLVVAALAREHGVPLQVHGPMGPLALRDLMCSARVIVNPIVPPSESHYSLALPLAVGRAVVTTRAEAAEPFVIDGGGVVAVPAGEPDAWRAAIEHALADHERLGARALEQARSRHDLDRFFLSALEHTLGSERVPR
jgi:hypothetical protein